MVFGIYKCIIKPLQPDLFSEHDSGNLPEAQRILHDILLTPPKIYKTQKNGNEQPYTTSLLRSDEDIFVMRMSDPKGVQLIDVQQNPYDVVNFPPCYIIYDNRPGRSTLAIEKRSDSFDRNTDKVRDLLEKALGNELFKYDLRIEVNIKKRVGDFWDIVDEYKQEQNDRVKSVKFSFPNPALSTPVEDAAKLAAEKLKYLTALTEATKATKGVLQLDSEENSSLELKKQSDVGHMVALCCDNGYDLSVFFEQYGEFKYGEEKRMIKTLDEAVVTHYVEGKEDPALWHGSASELKGWLDDIFENAEKYVESHNLNKRGKKRN